jgi:hypothetical protein
VPVEPNDKLEDTRVPSSQMGARLLVAIGLAGCNQMFGVHETAPLDADIADGALIDLDDDGVLDVIDNCPEVPNPLQENQDGDPYGDVCDPCLQGANSDEDGDLALDGCDNCPQLSNSGQENSDADDLGDVCDPANVVHHTRAAFDGFGEPLSLLWIPEVANWEAVDGTAHATTQPLFYEIGMWSRFIEVIGTAWIVETAVSVDDVPTGQRAGLYTRSRNGALDHACYLEQTSVGWSLKMAVNDPANPMTPFTAMTDLTALPPQPVRLRLRFESNMIVCDIPGVAALMIGSPDTRTGAGFVVSSTGPRFHYLDAIGSQ